MTRRERRERGARSATTGGAPTHTNSHRHSDSRGAESSTGGAAVDKFVWLRAVFADTRIAAGEKVVLAYVAVFDVLYGSDTFCVRQSTLADHCGTTRKTVNLAFRRAKRLGYFALSRQRQLGRGHHGGDELRLTLPETCNESSHVWGEKRVTDLPETCNANDRKRVTDLLETCNESSQRHAVRAAETTPQSSLQSSLESSGGKASHAQARTTPPPPKKFKEQRTAPDGASPEENDEPKYRPELTSAINTFTSAFDIDRADSPAPRRDDERERRRREREHREREERARYAEQLAAVDDCDLCDDYGYIGDEQCRHGIEPPR